jgi:hypothetical protein
MIAAMAALPAVAFATPDVPAEVTTKHVSTYQVDGIT